MIDAPQAAVLKPWIALLIAVMSVVGCRDRSPSQGHEEVELRVGTLREGSHPPGVEEVADCLLAALPELDRERARPVLVGELLPRALRGSAARDRGVAEVVFERLGEGLSAVAPHRRLRQLRVLLHEEIIYDLSRTALHLALARYLKGRTTPLPRDFAEGHADFLRELKPLVALSVNDVERRADELLQQLEDWRRVARRDYPDVGAEGDWSTAMSAARRARSGDFTTATMNLYDLLREMGEPTFELPSY